MLNVLKTKFVGIRVSSWLESAREEWERKWRRLKGSIQREYAVRKKCLDYRPGPSSSGYSTVWRKGMATLSLGIGQENI